MTILLATLLVTLHTEGTTCRWTRADLSGGPSVDLAVLDEPCGRVTTWWSDDGRRAVALIGSQTKRAILVDVARGATRPLPPLPEGIWFGAVSVDAKGGIALFGTEYVPDAEITRDRKNGLVTIRGVEHPLADHPGAPALARSFRLERGVWTAVDTVATTSEACDAPGLTVLPGYPERIVRTTHEVGEDRIRISRDGVTSTAVAGMEDGPDGEERIPLAPIRTASGTVLPALEDGAPVQVTMQSGVVLVVTRKVARVYDAKTGALLRTETGVSRAELR